MTIEGEFTPIGRKSFLIQGTQRRTEGQSRAREMQTVSSKKYPFALGSCLWRRLKIAGKKYLRASAPPRASASTALIQSISQPIQFEILFQIRLSQLRIGVIAEVFLQPVGGRTK